MPEETVAKFEVKRISILDEDGHADEKIMPKLSDKQIKEFYEWMVLTRVYDDKAVKLQRQGRIGTYPSMLGQEATIIGSGLAFDKKDWIIPSFRETSIYFIRGVEMSQLFQAWGGDGRGLSLPRSANMLPMAIPVGTQTLHAVGVAMAAKLKGDKIAVATFFGDGATSEGDVMEAMNFAGVYKAPVVFINQNNQWAISVPRKKQTAAETLAQKAIAAGFEGIQVDGNDVFAVYKVVKYALEKARKGNGPTFIECVTYRMNNHTTSDDALKYRDEKEVKTWEKRDPIDRLAKYMKKKKLFTEDYRRKVLEKATKMVDDAVAKYESTPPQKIEDIFAFTYEKLTPDLEEQRQDLLDSEKGEGEK